MPKFFDKLWGSGPTTSNAVLNLSLLGVQPTISEADLIGAGCYITDGANPQELFSIQFNTCFAAAYNAAVPLGMYMLAVPHQNFSTHLNISMKVPTRGTSSSVMPLAMDGVYRSKCSNPLTMVINSFQAVNSLPMFMNNQTTGDYINSHPLNLTIRWNPANNLMMFMKCHGISITRYAPLLTEVNLDNISYATEVDNDFLLTQHNQQIVDSLFANNLDGVQIELENGSDTLGTPFPLPLFMPSSAVLTNTFTVSMPVVHAQKSRVLTLTTRGF